MKKLVLGLVIAAGLVACGSKNKNANSTPDNKGGMQGSGSAMGGAGYGGAGYGGGGGKMEAGGGGY